MSHAVAVAPRVTAPRITMILAGLLALGVLLEGAFAGGFLGGSQVWRSWHENVGTVLILIPLASLLVGLALQRRQPEDALMLASRLALLILVIAVVVTGNVGGSLLAIHIPAAVAMAGVVVRQVMLATQARNRQP